MSRSRVLKGAPWWYLSELPAGGDERGVRFKGVAGTEQRRALVVVMRKGYSYKRGGLEMGYRTEQIQALVEIVKKSLK